MKQSQSISMKWLEIGNENEIVLFAIWNFLEMSKFINFLLDFSFVSIKFHQTFSSETSNDQHFIVFRFQTRFQFEIMHENLVDFIQKTKKKIRFFAIFDPITTLMRFIANNVFISIEPFLFIYTVISSCTRIHSYNSYNIIQI